MTRERARREIDSLDFYLQNHTDDYGEESHTAMMMAIDALSRSENPNKWIPISEGLPEEGKIVMVSTDHAVYPEARYTKECGWEWPYEYGSDYLVKLTDDVTAWMPLPKPYKVESEG